MDEVNASSLEAIKAERAALVQRSRDLGVWEERRDVWRDEGTESQTLCGLLWRVFMSKVTGEVSRQSARCGSWNCPTCGPERVGRVFEHIAQRIALNEGVFYVCLSVPRSEQEPIRNRIKVRRKEAGASLLTVVRFDGRDVGDMLHLFADADLGGTKPPEKLEWLDFAAALTTLSATLTVPGIGPYGIIAQGNWVMKEHESPGLHHFLGSYGQSAVMVALSEEGLRLNAPMPVSADIPKVMAKLARRMRELDGD